MIHFDRIDPLKTGLCFVNLAFPYETGNPHCSGVEDLDPLHTLICIQYQGNISLRFSSNSK